MPAAIVTGSGGLIGSESVRHFVAGGFDVVGIENDMRAQLLRAGGLDRARDRAPLVEAHPEFRSVEARHPRRRRRRPRLRRRRRDLELVVHTAAQPSHDWAAREPQTDFGVNANGTLNLLEAARRHRPGRDLRLHLDEQGLRRPAELPAAGRRRLAPRAAATTTATTAASTPRCRSTARRTRCSASRRPPPTCWCRSTAATSTCRPSASAAAASPGPATRAPSCTASSPT